MSDSIRLPWPDKALSPNARPNRYELARIKKRARQDAFAMTRISKVVPFKDGTLLAVKTTFYPPDRRLHDEDNLKARMKSSYDGIADALGVNDRFFRHAPVTIAEPVKNGAVVITIQEAT